MCVCIYMYIYIYMYVYINIHVYELVFWCIIVTEVMCSFNKHPAWNVSLERLHKGHTHIMAPSHTRTHTHIDTIHTHILLSPSHTHTHTCTHAHTQNSRTHTVIVLLTRLLSVANYMRLSLARSCVCVCVCVCVWRCQYYIGLSLAPSCQKFARKRWPCAGIHSKYSNTVRAAHIQCRFRCWGGHGHGHGHGHGQGHGCQSDLLSTLPLWYRTPRLAKSGQMFPW
jgi:hypothetical protein